MAKSSGLDAGSFIGTKVQPRTGHAIVFQFNGPVLVPGAASATPAGTTSVTFQGNEVFVALTGVPNSTREVKSSEAT